MVTHSFSPNGQFEVVDWTEEVLTIPNQWGTIGNLGLFEEESVSEHVITFEEISSTGGIIVDRVRGERNNVGQDSQRKLHAAAIPHFPHDDFILPGDIKGKRAYGRANEAEELAFARARKLKRIRETHAQTLEFARAKALTTGDVFAPNGTVVLNWFTEFGITQKTVDFTFGTGTTDLIAKVEEVVAHIQDNIGNGGVISGVVGLASPEFFTKFVSHPTVKAAYQYYTSTEEPLRNRLSAGGGNSSAVLQRRFRFGGVELIEMRDSYPFNGVNTRLIPAGDCVFVPVGTDAFKTYFSPANKFGLLNTLGEKVYVFEYPSLEQDKIVLQSESNFVNVVRRPAAVVRGFSSN